MTRKPGSEGLPWSDPASDPLADILDAKKAAEDGYYGLFEAEEEDSDDIDLGTCPYYRSAWLKQELQPGEKPVCSFGCQEEPGCVTNEPEKGWPSVGRPT